MAWGFPTFIGSWSQINHATAATPRLLSHETCGFWFEPTTAPGRGQQPARTGDTATDTSEKKG